MKLKVLIADDSPIVREMLSAQLLELGHEIVGEESTGKGVLPAYRRHKPDLLILDISFDDKDGLAVLREVRADTPKANVLMLSGNDQKKVQEITASLGARLLVKPYSIDNLNDAIRSLFGEIRAAHTK